MIKHAIRFPAYLAAAYGLGAAAALALHYHYVTRKEARP